MLIDLTNKVKPCPLCGSNKIYIETPRFDYIYSIHILCMDCGLKGFKNFTNDISIDEGTNRLIDYWNTRQGGILS